MALDPAWTGFVKCLAGVFLEFGDGNIYGGNSLVEVKCSSLSLRRT